MNTALRRISLSILAALLFLSLLGLAWSYALSATVRNQDTVKGWLNDSGFYDTSAGAFLTQFAEESEQPGLADAANNSEVQRIANDAFGTDFLKNNSEKVIDAVYAWLEGEADTPEFRINIGEAGQELAAGLGNFAEQRAASLPACTPEQLTDIGEDFDVLNTPCLPAGVSPQQAGAQVEQELLASLDDPSLANIDSGDIWASTKADAAWQNGVRDAYQGSRWLPHVSLLLAVAASAGIVFVSSTKRKGISRASLTFITGGLVVGGSALVLARGPDWISSAVSQLEDTQQWGEILLGILREAGKDISSRLWWFAAAYLIIGIVAFMLAKFIGRSSTKTPPAAPEPVPPIDDSPKTRPVTDVRPPARNTPPRRPRPPRKIQL